MLSITKINASSHQAAAHPKGGGYLHYLGAPTTRQKGDFDDYARGKDGVEGPAPFWACKGAALLGLDDMAEAEQVERLAKGFHPVTGRPLVKGAGDGHVMGLDMTFSAPKDVSAVFAGSDEATREALIECVQESARAALGYAEAAAVTRHEHAGRVKQIAEAAIAACYTHFSSRALDPQLHVHAFVFNAGKRRGSSEWSALEHRPQFERKLATGILFRVELASRLKGLGFQIEAAGPYFTIKGIDESQREALSTRSRQIADYMRDRGMADADGAAAREIAALNTRDAKSEPPLRELIAGFASRAAELGITPQSVAAMRAGPAAIEPPFAIDHAETLAALMESQSCATAQEALALICEKAMGLWPAAECLAELERFMACDQVVQLGRTEQLTSVFTSKATRDLEAGISRRVADGEPSRSHRVDPNLIEKQFARMEAELRAKLGVEVSLGQQRKAALRIASETGRTAFVEGWAGTGKTTMLRAVGAAYKEAGFSVVGCCQSAAASQNLTREAGIESRTIASLLLSLRKGRAHLHAKSVVVLDEAGMVGSREFATLQDEAMKAGAKLVCVGDPKQLQPIDAGGIFGSLMARHGKSEISDIRRQRTDFEPLLKWLSGKEARMSKATAQILRGLPEDARMEALEAICRNDERLGKAFDRWRSRFDFEWMREAVEGFAKGEAKDALALLDAKGRLKLIAGQENAAAALISAWAKDKTPLAAKAIVAGTRTEVADLNSRARAVLIGRGLVDDARGVDVQITMRDESTAARRFAAGDRIVFTMNDRALGVANGVAGSVVGIRRDGSGDVLEVELDDANERNEKNVGVPASFGRFDHAYCLTNHKAQGRTFDSAHVLANPSMADREWTYVAASRSRFSTTIYVNSSLLGLVDPESHREDANMPKARALAIESLAGRMRRSRAKGTSLDYDDAPEIESPAEPTAAPRGDGLGAGERAARALARIRKWSANAARSIFASRDRQAGREPAAETDAGLDHKPESEQRR
jgi:conjugative relaxase-like TrwC/TraI family protein